MELKKEKRTRENSPSLGRFSEQPTQGQTEGQTEGPALRMRGSSKTNPKRGKGPARSIAWGGVSKKLKPNPENKLLAGSVGSASLIFQEPLALKSLPGPLLSIEQTQLLESQKLKLYLKKRTELADQVMGKDFSNQKVHEPLSQWFEYYFQSLWNQTSVAERSMKMELDHDVSKPVLLLHGPCGSGKTYQIKRMCLVHDLELCTFKVTSLMTVDDAFNTFKKMVFNHEFVKPILKSDLHLEIERGELQPQPKPKMLTAQQKEMISNVSHIRGITTRRSKVIYFQNPMNYWTSLDHSKELIVKVADWIEKNIYRNDFQFPKVVFEFHERELFQNQSKIGTLTLVKKMNETHTSIHKIKYLNQMFTKTKGIFRVVPFYSFNDGALYYFHKHLLERSNRSARWNQKQHHQLMDYAQGDIRQFQLMFYFQTLVQHAPSSLIKNPNPKDPKILLKRLQTVFEVGGTFLSTLPPKMLHEWSLYVECARINKGSIPMFRLLRAYVNQDPSIETIPDPDRMKEEPSEDDLISPEKCMFVHLLLQKLRKLFASQSNPPELIWSDYKRMYSLFFLEVDRIPLFQKMSLFREWMGRFKRMEVELIHSIMMKYSLDPDKVVSKNSSEDYTLNEEAKKSMEYDFVSGNELYLNDPNMQSYLIKKPLVREEKPENSENSDEDSDDHSNETHPMDLSDTTDEKSALDTLNSRPKPKKQNTKKKTGEEDSESKEQHHWISKANPTREKPTPEELSKLDYNVEILDLMSWSDTQNPGFLDNGRKFIEKQLDPFVFRSLVQKSQPWIQQRDQEFDTLMQSNSDLKPKFHSSKPQNSALSYKYYSLMSQSHQKNYWCCSFLKQVLHPYFMYGSRY